MRKKIKSNGNVPLTALGRRRRRLAIERAFEGVLDAAGFDWRNDPNMRETPQRVAKMYVEEIFAGCYAAAPKITEFPNDPASGAGFDQLIVTGRMTVKSFCSHHLLPVVGHCWIGILPRVGDESALVGLSKYSRIVQHYARRPQMQEALTQQIIEHVVKHTRPRGAAVMIKAQHMCQTHRGVQDNDAYMTTTQLHGTLLTEDAQRAEFFGRCQ